MPNASQPLFEKGDKVKIIKTHTARSQTKLWEGASGVVSTVQESQSQPGTFYYSIKFDDGSKEQGIDEDNIVFA